MFALAEGAEKMHPTLEPPEIGVVGKRGAKRAGEDPSPCGDGDGVGTPPKKAKTPPARTVRDGVLRGRPILQDVINGDR